MIVIDEGDNLKTRVTVDGKEVRMDRHCEAKAVRGF